MRPKAPSCVPSLDTLLDCLGMTAPAAAKHLDVSERTVYQWLKRGRAPRAALLALFWETTWGQSIVESHAVNVANSLKGLTDALRNENAALKSRILYLERVGHFGASNAPVFERSTIHDDVVDSLMRMSG